ncbi:hypothetical protein G7Y89_g2822 [Cudoniella acicularis]|uniref:Carrier domain-containing protein n=1 Tax=Cudoniella acicularis TaxID=354080 RepID=A0A8H4RSN6_9HELO|nr:hypothetical protein G7Y89_g2822 [Cudoniella acicularis]
MDYENASSSSKASGSDTPENLPFVQMSHTLSAGQKGVDPVAVIGFSFRFPGDAKDSSSFWQMMMESRCSSSEYPIDRLSNSRYHPDPNRKDTFPIRGGHFVEGKIAAFDASFFGIGATEAAALDPQQRGLLETTYRALENCGSANIDTACSSSLVALHLGVQDLLNGDSEMLQCCNLIFSPDWIHLLSNMKMLSPDNRCHSFDSRANGYSRGEGFGVLVLKRLSSAIRDGDTIRGIIRASGSNQDGFTPGIMQPSRTSQEDLIRETYSKAGLDMESTRFIEAHGTGTAIGDPLEAVAIGLAFRKARTTADPLYIGAVKSNIGHLEGASGIAGVIKTILVLEKGIIPPNTNFDLVNPQIDAEYLRIKFPLRATLWPSQGIRRASVNSFGFGGTNAHIVLDDVYHYLNERGLEASHQTIRSPTFQFNIDPALSTTSLTSDTIEQNIVLGLPKILVFSANDSNTLTTLISRYNVHFKQSDIPVVSSSDFLADLCYTLATKRSLLRWRSFIIVDNYKDLKRLDYLSSVPTKTLERPSLGYVFTGQGAQWARMGLELLQFPIFRRSLQESELNLNNIGCKWNLLEELSRTAAESNINKPEFSQPISTAVQLALVEFLRSFNIIPTAVVGHSSGEIAAAYCIGALSSREALKISYFRGQCAKKLAALPEPRGAMLAAGLSEHEAQKYIDQQAERSGRRAVTIACVNSNSNVTLSGDEYEIKQLKKSLDDRNIFTRQLMVDVAYHSHHMEVISEEYKSLIQGLAVADFSFNTCTMISSVTEEAIHFDQLRQPDYWVRNMVSPVRFHKIIERISNHSLRSKPKKLNCSHRAHVTVDMLIEIGPHSALQGPIQETLGSVSSQKERYASMLVRNQPAHQTALKVVGITHSIGCATNLESLYIPTLNETPHTLVDLPEYPFDHSKSYWYETRLSNRNRTHHQSKLDLLGKPAMDWNPLEAKWRNFIRLSDMPWVGDHVINGSLIYPAAGMLVMAIEAANQIADHDRNITGFHIKDVVFRKALVIPQDDEGIETYFSLRQPAASDNHEQWLDFRLCAPTENNVIDEWHYYCDGLIKIEYDVENRKLDELQHYQEIFRASSSKWNGTLTPQSLYRRLKSAGYGFGLSFQPLENIVCGPNTVARAAVKLYQWCEPGFSQPHIVHPTSLDGMLHLCLAALAKNCDEGLPTSVPTQIKNLWIKPSGMSFPKSTSVLAVATATELNTRHSEFQISVLDEELGQILMRTEGLRLTVVANSQILQDQPLDESPCYHLDHQPDIDLMGNQELEAYCSPKCYNSPEPVQFYRDLLFLAFVFLAIAIDGLGESPAAQPHLQMYVEWAKVQIQRYKDGTLPNSRPGWLVLMKDDEYLLEVISRVESASAQGHAFVATGQNLLNILVGKIDPQEFLFESDLVRNLYWDINNHRPCFESMTRYLDILSFKNPNMKILEIGAGTGGTTSKILSALCVDKDGKRIRSRYASYTYTDISSFFFEVAQKEFAPYSRIEYRQLDIEIDPVEQGLKEYSFDLIIAANVLHATKDIKKAIEHVRRLLKNGGKLLMHEITRPEILRSGFVFGLLPGWWLAQDNFRPQGPTMSSEFWASILKDEGFSGIDLEFLEFASEECQELSILLSTATVPVSEISAASVGTIIIDENSEVQQKAALGLQAAYKRESLVGCDIVTLDEAARYQTQNRERVIFFLELDTPILFNIKEKTFKIVRELLTSTAEAIWVTGGGGDNIQDPAWAMIDGLSRALRNEDLDKKLTVIALELPAEAFLNTQQLEKIYCISSASGNPPYNEPEYVEVGKIFTIPRVVLSTRLTEQFHQMLLPRRPAVVQISKAPAVKLAISSLGLLETLHFVQDRDEASQLSATEVEIEVKAIGLGQTDAQKALGLQPGEDFSNECSGVVTRCGVSCSTVSKGDRVAMIGTGLFKTFARGEASSFVKIPDTMSFTDAASIPFCFLTAQYALDGVARIRKGETVLIHTGAGPIGQATYQMAKHYEVEAFLTINFEEEKRLLVGKYGVSPDHIVEMDTAMGFHGTIMRGTNGRGVDVVVNAFAGQGLEASWECLAPYGRFINLNQANSTTFNLHANGFPKNASFISLDVARWLQDRPEIAAESIRTVFKLFGNGSLNAVDPIQVYDIHQITQAFKSMQSNTAFGKVVIEIAPHHQINTILDNKPSTLLDPQGAYLVSGGFGGIGRSIARWLVVHGARYLILISRSGAKGEAAIQLLKEFQEQGVIVQVSICDITDFACLKEVLSRSPTLSPPIRGCIQAAMVLKARLPRLFHYFKNLIHKQDCSFNRMSYEEWSSGTNCKTQGSWNLHKLLPTDLDFFIMLSSASGIVGIHGQANYCAGNTFMDALARYRVSIGQKTVAWDLGAMVDDGFAAEDKIFMKRILGYEAFAPVTRSYTSALLDHYCNAQLPLMHPEESQLIVGLGQGFTIQSQSIFAHTLRHESNTDPSSNDVIPVTDYKILIAESRSMIEAGSIATSGLIKKLSRTLSTLNDDVDLDKPLHVYGLDSLLAVDLKSWIRREFLADVPVFEIQGGATFNSIGLLIARTTQRPHGLWSL